jgi:hypothetical protein
MSEKELQEALAKITGYHFEHPTLHLLVAHIRNKAKELMTEIDGADYDELKELYTCEDGYWEDLL